MRERAAAQPRAATLLERVAAYVADSVVTFVLWAGLSFAVAAGDLDALRADQSLQLVAGFLFLVVPFAYFVVAEGLAATTLGKSLLGLRIVTGTGARPGLFHATVRNVLRLAWALGPLGPLFLALDALLIQHTELDQRVGDSAAGTRVVRVGRARAAID